MITFAAILLVMLIEPLTVLVSLALGAVLTKRAWVEPAALAGAIVFELALLVVLADRSLSGMVLAARGISMLLWANLGHLFVHGWSPIEDDDRLKIDIWASERFEHMYNTVADGIARIRRPRKGVDE